jgi:hypothetical protein
LIISPYTSTLQQQVYGAVDAVRPLTSTFGVFAATQLAANVATTVTAATGYTHAQVAAAVQAAIRRSSQRSRWVLDCHGPSSTLSSGVWRAWPTPRASLSTVAPQISLARQPKRSWPEP